MGALLLALVAAMTPFVAEPDIAYAQSQSKDTTLYALSITQQSGETPTVSAFMPAFVPGGASASGGYTAYAATGVTAVALSATASHTQATVAVVKAGEDEDDATDVNDTNDANNSFAGSVNTTAGEDTVILITVTAADDVETETYKLTVATGAAEANVTTLSALSLMAGGEDLQLMNRPDGTDDAESLLRLRLHIQRASLTRRRWLR